MSVEIEAFWKWKWADKGEIGKLKTEKFGEWENHWKEMWRQVRERYLILET